METDAEQGEAHMPNAAARRNWTLGIVSVALFMVVLDNLVVSVALPSIRRDFGASIQSLEWTVNAYVLAYAVLLLAGIGAFGVVFGLVRSQSLGWTAPTILASLIIGAAMLGAFVVWELRASQPMLPMSFFAKRSFAVTNVVSLSMYFGMFGSIFFLSQFMQNVLHNTPLQAGLKLLVWTGASMVVSPFAGYFSERLGSRVFMAAGLTLQAAALGWLAA